MNKRLIKKCLKNDRKAQSELYRLLFDVLMSVCVRYYKNRDDAVDILNEGFYKVLMNLDKYDHQKPFEAWAKRIMINTVIDQYRKNKQVREHEVELNETEMDVYTEYNEVDGSMEAEELEAMLLALGENERNVFNLYVIDGYSHREIAEMLEMSERSSKRYLAAARERLKKMLTQTTEMNKMSA